MSAPSADHQGYVGAAEGEGVAEKDAAFSGVEALASRAAARTWGMLRGEGRWIAAAIMPL